MSPLDNTMSFVQTDLYPGGLSHVRPASAVIALGSTALSGKGTADVYSLLLSQMTARLREAEETIARQKERLEFLETLSVTDELTGLLNRRGFVDSFRKELAAGRRSGIGGVLVVIDLDGFKSINDTFGHLAGDTYLRHVARALLENVRTRDIVARLGGDEFAVLITNTEPEGGLARAKLLAGVVNGRSCRLNRKSVPLRASFGAEAYTGQDREDEVTLRADTLMYKTKQDRKTKR